MNRTGGSFDHFLPPTYHLNGGDGRKMLSLEMPIYSRTRNTFLHCPHVVCVLCRPLALLPPARRNSVRVRCLYIIQWNLCSSVCDQQQVSLSRSHMVALAVVPQSNTALQPCIQPSFASLSPTDSVPRYLASSSFCARVWKQFSQSLIPVVTRVLLGSISRLIGAG